VSTAQERCASPFEDPFVLSIDHHTPDLMRGHEQSFSHQINSRRRLQVSDPSFDGIGPFDYTLEGGTSPLRVPAPIKSML